VLTTDYIAESNQKMKKIDYKSFRQTLQILGVGVNSTSTSSVLNFLSSKISHNENFFIVTPNPEFLVAAQNDEEFRKILNGADLAIPDGVGLLLASRFLGTKPLLIKRITDVDLVEAILERGKKENWKIGLVGARRGEMGEIRELLHRLRRQYSGLKIEALELVEDWPKKDFQIVFACQGMVKQEKWIWENQRKVKGVGFMGIGGSLDRLSGITPRAPELIRKFGLEWFWRLILNPAHFSRVWTACVIFPWLVLKERIIKV
jgi:N-acetylglucosaminyldiphosphoundecaprenol N-acetyl-beta-D-mannosaminyltransferase